MDILKLALGIALIAGYLAIRLGWTYRQDAKRKSGEKTLGAQAQFALLMVLGVVMLFGGLYFILMAFGG